MGGEMVVAPSRQRWAVKLAALDINFVPEEASRRFVVATVDY